MGLPRCMTNRSPLCSDCACAYSTFGSVHRRQTPPLGKPTVAVGDFLLGATTQLRHNCAAQHKQQQLPLAPCRQVPPPPHPCMLHTTHTHAAPQRILTHTPKKLVQHASTDSENSRRMNKCSRAAYSTSCIQGCTECSCGCKCVFDNTQLVSCAVAYVALQSVGRMAHT